MLCLFAVFAFSCNEEMERLLTDDYPESGTEYTTGHVLMVVIDGASGIAVNEAYNTRKASVIRSRTDRSLFTFYGLADNEEGVSKERGWANLLTGTTKNGLDVNQGIDELETPSFLQRLLPILKERLRPTVKPLMLLLLKSMVKQSRIS